MSRVGQKPISVPEGVSVSVTGRRVQVKGPKGELTMEVPSSLSVVLEGKTIRVSRQGDTKEEKALHGTNQRLICNMLAGVTQGFKKSLEVQGVGYRAAVQGKQLVLNVGRAGPVEHAVPPGIGVQVAEGTRIEVSGPDKAMVGQVAARIRASCPPEPYKGKGIRYVNEYVRRKAGKAVA